MWIVDGGSEMTHSLVSYATSAELDSKRAAQMAWPLIPW